MTVVSAVEFSDVHRLSAEEFQQIVIGIAPIPIADIFAAAQRRA